MDSSDSSERLAIAAGRVDAVTFKDRARSRGHRGGVIAMHRALARFTLEPLDIVLSISLVLLFTLVWLVCLPWVCRFWRYVFETTSKALTLNLKIGLSEHHFTPLLRFAIAYPQMEDVGPDAQTWWLTAAGVVALFWVSFLLSKKLIPLAYLLRAALLVQLSALVFFAVAPGRFPHTPNSYMEGLMTYGTALISLVPLVFGLTYYIFDFGLVRKLLITAMTMAHLSLFLPVQILLQATILQKTVLFMPVLYIIFGMPLDVLVIIGFYSWGMSWPAKTGSAL